MKNIDKVELRKMSQKYMRQAQSEAKSDHCLLCGKPMTSFCNSHSVPEFALKSIAENGEVVLASKLMGNEISDNKSGVNKSGTFHLICDNCDNSFFQDYESQEKLAVGITDKMLAEIAVKNFLLQLNKRYTERHLYRLCEKISVKSKTVIKNDITGAAVRSRSNYLQYTTDTVICQDTSAISLMEWSAAEWNQADSRRLSRAGRDT